QAEVTPLTLSDVALFSVNGTHLNSNDAFSGTQNFDVGQLSGNGGGNLNNTVIKMRSDGLLTAYQGNNTAGEPDGVVGQIVIIDPTTGAEHILGNDNIPEPGNPNTDPNALASESVDSLAWQRDQGAFGGGNYDLWYAARDQGGMYNGGATASRLYQANPTTGATA